MALYRVLAVSAALPGLLVGDRVEMARDRHVDSLVRAHVIERIDVDEPVKKHNPEPVAVSEEDDHKDRHKKGK